MKLKFVLAGVLIAVLVTPSMAIEGKEKYYVARDMDSKKCSVAKENPTTGKVGTGQTYESEAAAKAAMNKMADCAGK
jgi:hypothetical protein